ncbi:MAG: glycerophosphodiester phosphodiesterase, partial [Actinomycetota bacterium]
MSVSPPLPSLRNPPIAFAHRGARAHAPENTIEAFELALRLGATGLESDVWITSDGVCVLDHDGVVGSVLRRRSIASVRRDQLAGHIPSLEVLYEACGSVFELSLDVKDPA